MRERCLGGGPRPYTRRVSSPRNEPTLTPSPWETMTGGGSTGTTVVTVVMRTPEAAGEDAVPAAGCPDAEGPVSRLYRSCAQPPATKTPAAMTTRRATTRSRRCRR